MDALPEYLALSALHIGAVAGAISTILILLLLILVRNLSDWFLRHEQRFARTAQARKRASLSIHG